MIKLDWSRLLAFDQAEACGDGAGARNLHDPRLIKLGAKIGTKGAGRGNAAILPLPTTVQLDWTRLLGFDQAAREVELAGARNLNDPRLVKLGAKFGGKLGGRRPDIADVKLAR